MPERVTAAFIFRHPMLFDYDKDRNSVYRKAEHDGFSISAMLTEDVTNSYLKQWPKLKLLKGMIAGNQIGRLYVPAVDRLAIDGEGEAEEFLRLCREHDCRIVAVTDLLSTKSQAHYVLQSGVDEQGMDKPLTRKANEGSPELAPASQENTMHYSEIQRRLSLIKQAHTPKRRYYNEIVAVGLTSVTVRSSKSGSKDRDISYYDILNGILSGADKAHSRMILTFRCILGLEQGNLSEDTDEDAG